jgi:squalene-hopene/tetraprenyl-beta-curcumene cyclase
MELVRFPARTARPSETAPRKSSPAFASELIAPVRNAIVRARRFLISEQRSNGVWVGRQTTDVSLASQLIFLNTFLNRSECELVDRCAATIMGDQRLDGSWSLTPDGPADVSISVQAYFALKLAGYEATDRRLSIARETIRDLGGADAANLATRYFLALLGELSYDYCPAVTPESLLFGGQRKCLRMPMAIAWSHRPVHAVGIEQGVRELFVNRPSVWSNVDFVQHRNMLKRIIRSHFGHASRFCERRGWTPMRKRALCRAESQLVEQVQPPHIAELSLPELIWHAIALHAIGYAADSPEYAACDDRLDELVDVEPATGFARPRLRTISSSDTAAVARSLTVSGISMAHIAVESAMDALCQSPIPEAHVFAIDACDALRCLTHSEMGPIKEALPPDFDICRDWPTVDLENETTFEINRQARAFHAHCLVELLRGNQNKDGGWSPLLGSQDSRGHSEPDVTGAVLEALSAHDSASDRRLRMRGVEFLRSTQKADGSWHNSAHAKPIVCTSSAIRGLVATGLDRDEDMIAAAINWLLIRQQPDGSWSSSGIETAAALLALSAADLAEHPAVRRGIAFLIDSQDENGGWTDVHFVWQDPLSNQYVRNELHAVTWPLLAISEWVVAASSSQSSATGELSLRLVTATAEF